MNLPFTADQFYGIFRAYNESVWPAQVVLLGLAVASIGFVFFPCRWSGRAVSAVLALLWAWLGIAYHLAFFSTINPLAYLFAGVSLAGSAVFAWHGVVRRNLEFRMRRNAHTAAGLGLLVFALGMYPAWSAYVGHRYPAMPTFGLPCPTTLYTVGMLAFLVAPFPRAVFVVPLLWCLVGAQAAFLLGVAPDLGLLVAAVVATARMARCGAPPDERYN